MKKITIIFMISILFVVIGCSNSTVSPTTGNPTTLIPISNQSTTVDNSNMGLTQQMINEFSTQSVTIKFSYHLDSYQTEIIDALVDDFENLFPNVDIVAERSKDDSTVVSTYYQNYIGNNSADLILANQDYLAMLTTTFEPLESYVLSSATANGLNVGLNLNDYDLNLFTNFIGNDEYITFPYTRMTQLVFANQDILSSNEETLNAAGISVTNSGLLKHDSSLSLADLGVISSVLDDSLVLVIEKPNLTLETFLGQNDIPLINNNVYQIDVPNTTALMTSLRTLADSNVITLASDFEQNYSFQPFYDQETLLAVSDVESLRYMVVDMPFAVDILPMIETNQSGAFFYGSDFAINSSSSDAEKFYSWMFIRMATDLSYNYMDFCMDAGYSPIYKPSIYVDEQDYSYLLGLANDYLDNDGNPNWNNQDIVEWDYLVFALIQNAYSISRQNVYQHRVFPKVNTSEIENEINAFITFVDDVFYSTESIVSLTEELDESLNN